MRAPGRGHARPARPGRAARPPGVDAVRRARQQRVAIGAVLTAHPRVLVLDEPTSALDPAAAEDVLAARAPAGPRPRAHRADGRAPARAGRAVRGQRAVAPGRRRRRSSAVRRRDHGALADRTAGGRRSGARSNWSPLPLTVRDARRRPATLRDRLCRLRRRSTCRRARSGDVVALDPAELSVRYGSVGALREASIWPSGPGEIVALMGRNGAGKSTLLGTLTGAGATPRRAPSRRRRSSIPARCAGARLIERVGLVPQQPADLLYGESVARRVRRRPTATRGAATGTAAGAAAAYRGRHRHRAPSARPVRGAAARARAGGRAHRRPAAACCSTSRPAASTTRPRRGWSPALRELAADGHAIVLATHDVELAAEVSARTIVLADGEIVADGPSREVVIQTRRCSRRRWPRSLPRCRT